jgi:hypothetical protein
MTADPANASVEVLRAAREFLDREIKALWPNAIGADGFRWELLCDPFGDGAGADGASGRGAGCDGGGGEGAGGDKVVNGPGKLETQYWKANVDPSDLYVQSLPGTGRFRIAPGSTGFANLAVAGDWTDCGLNAGCLEAATLSGQLAAAAIIERNVRR